MSHLLFERGGVEPILFNVKLASLLGRFGSNKLIGVALRAEPNQVGERKLNSAPISGARSGPLISLLEVIIFSWA